MKRAELDHDIERLDAAAGYWLTHWDDAQVTASGLHHDIGINGGTVHLGGLLFCTELIQRTEAERDAAAVCYDRLRDERDKLKAEADRRDAAAAKRAERKAAKS